MNNLTFTEFRFSSHMEVEATFLLLSFTTYILLKSLQNIYNSSNILIIIITLNIQIWY